MRLVLSCLVETLVFELSPYRTITHFVTYVVSLYQALSPGTNFVQWLTYRRENNMGNSAQKEWRMAKPARRMKVAIDETTALGGVTLALFTYILYHFIYPLIAKGILF